MKIALYIEDGLEQLVLTPESEHEKSMLALLNSGQRSIEIKQGAFFMNSVGYVRHGHGIGDPSKWDSTMLVMHRKANAEAAL